MDVNPWGNGGMPYSGPPSSTSASVTTDLTVDWDLLGGGRLAWSEGVRESIVVVDGTTRQVTTLRFPSVGEFSPVTFWNGSLALAPGGGLISFVANLHNTWPSRAFVTPIGGGQTVPLAPVDFQCTSSFWAPDGQTVFFLTGVTQADGSQRDAVARAKADGSQFQRVVPTSRFRGGALWGHGSVSADGQKLLLAAPNDGIYVAGINDGLIVGAGSLVRISSSPPGRFEYGPVWSPDGTRIAFVSNQGSVSAGSETEGPFDLVVMSADGSNRTTMASLPADLVCRPFVAWSPAGNKLASTAVPLWIPRASPSRSWTWIPASPRH